MIKPANAMTSDERAAVIKAIRDGAISWPYRSASGSALTINDVEAHGQIDSERGVIILGGFEFRLHYIKP